MSAEIIPITSRLDGLWNNYVGAARRAQTTGRLEDGIAAGRAWRKWLDAFMTPDQRNELWGAE